MPPQVTHGSYRYVWSAARLERQTKRSVNIQRSPFLKKKGQARKTPARPTETTTKQTSERTLTIRHRTQLPEREPGTERNSPGRNQKRTPTRTLPRSPRTPSRQAATRIRQPGPRTAGQNGQQLNENQTQCHPPERNYTARPPIGGIDLGAKG